MSPGVDDAEVISEKTQSSAGASQSGGRFAGPARADKKRGAAGVADGRDVEHLRPRMRQPCGERRAGGMGAYIAALKRFGTPHISMGASRANTSTTGC